VGAFSGRAGFLSESLKRSRLIWRGCGFAQVIVSSCLEKKRSFFESHFLRLCAKEGTRAGGCVLRRCNLFE